MDDYSCEICFLEFDEDKILPKVLRCGHTFCYPCINFLVNNRKYCPKCKASIRGSEGKHLPTNYSLLSLLVGMKDLKIKQSHLNELQSLQNELEDKRDTLLFNVQEKTYHVDKLNEDIAKLSNLLDNESDLLLQEKIKMLVQDIKRDLIAADYAISLSKEIRLSPTLCLKKIKNTQEFFNKISSKIYKGEEVFVTGKVNGEIRYGKISIWSKMLLIHSLSLAQIGTNSDVILLDDFKKCATKHNFTTFLKLPLEDGGVITVVIKMIDSLLSNRFIKLCTGECGPSYKDTHYAKGSSTKESSSILVVSKDDAEDFTADDYDIKSYEWKTFSSNTILIERYSNGGFEMFKNHVPGTKYISVVGRVVSNPHLIEKVTFGTVEKILDSGIGFYF